MGKTEIGCGDDTWAVAQPAPKNVSMGCAEFFAAIALPNLDHFDFDIARDRIPRLKQLWLLFCCNRTIHFLSLGESRSRSPLSQDCSHSAIPLLARVGENAWISVS